MKEPKNFWDSIPKPYQMGDHKHRVFLLNLLQDKGVKSLLDVGCGTGPIYQIIKKKKMPFDYKGVDYSEDMIDVCKQQFPEANFGVEDARKLSEPRKSWDCVLLLHSLDHVNDYSKAISEAARVSKKYVCIVLWRAFADDNQVHMNDKNWIGKDPGSDPWDDTYLMQYSRKHLEKEFKKNKLKIEEEAEGEVLNSGQSKYNFLFLLSKYEKK